MYSYEGMNNGEIQLYNLLEAIEDETHKIHANIVIGRHNEGTNQIDALLICQKGVFVFEMKDYNGWIFGNEDNKEWTQIINKGKFGSKKIRFRNPVKQNDNHIKTIKHLLNRAEIFIPVFNVIVFGEGASLKEVTASIDVVNLSSVFDVIDKYPDMSVDQALIDKIHTVISENSSNDLSANVNHIKYVETLSNSNKLDLEESGIAKEYGTKIKENHGDDDLSIGFLLKISSIFILVFFFFLYGMKYPLLLVLVILLFVPSKKRKRSRKNKNYSGIIGLIFIIVFIGSYGISRLTNDDFFVKAAPNDNSVIETNMPLNTEPVEAITEVVLVEANALESATMETEYMTERVDEITITTEGYIESTTEGTNESTTEGTNESTTEITRNISKLTIFLKIGIDKAQVLQVLGAPTKINGFIDYYKNSSITYDENDMVIGWKNVYGELNPILIPRRGGKLSLGIQSEDVINALGTPTEIVSIYPFQWYYNNSIVTFDSDWNINGWKNTYGELNPAVIAPTGGKLALGISSEDIIKAMGTPTEVGYTNPYTWNYRNAYITFNSDWKVSGWKNTYGELNPSLVVPRGGKLSLGISRDDLIGALGTPSEISFTSPYKWNYQNAFVTFNSDWIVTGWKNTYGELNPALTVPVGGKLSLGLSKDELIAVLGTPSEIVSNNPYQWFYKISTVTFDTEWRVNGWKDVYGELIPSFQNPQGGKLNVGSSKDDVIKVLGTPSEVNSRNPLVWYYRNSTIEFDVNWNVSKWKNVYGQFDGVFPVN